MSRQSYVNRLNKEQRWQLRMEAKEKGITMTFLANICGVTVGLISKYFSGDCNLAPSMEELIITTIRDSRRFVWQKVKVYIDE